MGRLGTARHRRSSRSASSEQLEAAHAALRPTNADEDELGSGTRQLEAVYGQGEGNGGSSPTTTSRASTAIASNSKASCRRSVAMRKTRQNRKSTPGATAYRAQERKMNSPRLDRVATIARRNELVRASRTNCALTSPGMPSAGARRYARASGAAKFARVALQCRLSAHGAAVLRGTMERPCGLGLVRNAQTRSRAADHAKPCRSPQFLHHAQEPR